MPRATVRGASINYAVLGERGPWVALSPGGRRGMDGVQGLGQRIADAGYRVVLFDRRNTGASDVVLEGDESEYEIWADDLHDLLSQLGALPAYVGGSSSGCRLALLFALRYPEAVQGLLLWRVTGGAHAVKMLAHQYYGEYIEAAERGGMAAVCDTEHFKECIANHPPNRDRLMDMDPQRFIASMAHWRGYFTDSADLPVIGVTEDALRSIEARSCIIPGDDQRHPPRVGENLGRLLPNSEVHVVMVEQPDVDLTSPEVWNAKEAEIAAVFVDFLNRVSAPARV